MRIASTATYLIVVLTVLSLSGSARAASINLYLRDDGSPGGSMGTDRPSGGAGGSRSLPPSSGGSGETDPGRFQEWSYDLSNMTASVNEFTIWIAPSDPSGEGKLAISVHILDCASSCVTISNSTRSMSGVTSPTRVTLPVTLNGHAFGEGHDLKAKVTVPAESARDVTIYYASKNRDSNLHLSALAVTPPPTTTTVPTTTTTVPPSTTTTIGQPSTTVQPSTTTTSPPDAGVTPPPSTTTTTTRATSDTVAVVAAPTTTTAPRPSEPDEIPAESERSQPRMVHLADPTDEVATADPPSHTLKPQEGMLIVFSTAVEAFQLYWQVALALGTLMAILLILGFSRLEIPGPAQNPFERIRRFR